LFLSTSGTIDVVATNATDEEVLEQVRRICLACDGADEGELQGRPLFRVGRRRFAIFNGLDSPPRPRWAVSGRSLHFLSDPSERDALRQDPRFVTSPHHGDRGWFAVVLDGAVDWRELAELLQSAHRQVSRTL
jgi:predicted DNA-binding protein (MmcQ/YjbR family)